MIVCFTFSPAQFTSCYLSGMVHGMETTVPSVDSACRDSLICSLRALSRFLEWRCGCTRSWAVAHGLRRAYPTPYQLLASGARGAAPATCGLVGFIARNAVPRASVIG